MNDNVNAAISLRVEFFHALYSLQKQKASLGKAAAIKLRMVSKWLSAATAKASARQQQQQQSRLVVDDTVKTLPEFGGEKTKMSFEK